MTLTAEQSSNKAKYEAAPTAEIIDIIRTAMGAGCIRPCHVYDAVDELICRIQALENRPKRNCDRFDTVKDAAIAFARERQDAPQPCPDFTFSAWLLALARRTKEEK
jgi:hypothetical protein